ncbi:MAG: hypothetical protein DRP00_04245 [Candidatus Aenigmatarchaeota archaeon]|nr:MAG: hypothetical protein DRP00_04245 [Candidatus Aenigmarchaeota archaeon]
MIRSSVIHIDNANTGKRQKLLAIMQESRRVINVFIDELWKQRKFNDKFSTLKTDTWLSSRMQQCLGKQALSIVKSQRKRKKKTKPVYDGNVLELDQRFVQFRFDENSFDVWIHLSSIGNGIILNLPGKKHRHFNLFFEDSAWTMKNSCRLSYVSGKWSITVFFEKDFEQQPGSKVVGLDCGYKKLAVVSDGQVIGKELEDKIAKISRKKQGSKSFYRALKERDDYVALEIKHIDLSNVKTVVVEDLKNVKKKTRGRISKKFMNKLQRWAYSQFLQRLRNWLEVVGVQCLSVDPAYTSQTCSKCGCVDRKSRNRERFCCTACGFESDADLNASQNILMRFLEQENMVPALEPTS